ncbi:unnamed protein product [Vitrella brassicaformis CCMP3155]|uniref:Uncharacterized protein n=1 Tax=Vitrella brassicaformis (strain CCMP3155) TaxID=1169540 RepID=A0A0G4EC48_VITBC|nr:unnamed protein product [Vitrella brassicaformis CCMP3155]|eukprot:CEL92907.1 unnamed protein product [Vitrella brassicaformis CCMP3155]
MPKPWRRPAASQPPHARALLPLPAHQTADGVVIDRSDSSRHAADEAEVHQVLERLESNDSAAEMHRGLLGEYHIFRSTPQSPIVGVPVGEVLVAKATSRAGFAYRVLGRHGVGVPLLPKRRRKQWLNLWKTCLAVELLPLDELTRRIGRLRGDSPLTEEEDLYTHIEAWFYKGMHLLVNHPHRDAFIQTLQSQLKNFSKWHEGRLKRRLQRLATMATADDRSPPATWQLRHHLHNEQLKSRTILALKRVDDSDEAASLVSRLTKACMAPPDVTVLPWHKDKTRATTANKPQTIGPSLVLTSGEALRVMRECYRVGAMEQVIMVWRLAQWQGVAFNDDHAFRLAIAAAAKLDKGAFALDLYRDGKSAPYPVDIEASLLVSGALLRSASASRTATSLPEDALEVLREAAEGVLEGDDETAPLNENALLMCLYALYAYRLLYRWQDAEGLMQRLKRSVEKRPPSLLSRAPTSLSDDTDVRIHLSRSPLSLVAACWGTFLDLLEDMSAHPLPPSTTDGAGNSSLVVQPSAFDRSQAPVDPAGMALRWLDDARGALGGSGVTPAMVAAVVGACERSGEASKLQLAANLLDPAGEFAEALKGCPDDLIDEWRARLQRKMVDGQHWGPSQLTDFSYHIKKHAATMEAARSSPIRALRHTVRPATVGRLLHSLLDSPAQLNRLTTSEWLMVLEKARSSKQNAMCIELFQQLKSHVAEKEGFFLVYGAHVGEVIRAYDAVGLATAAEELARRAVREATGERGEGGERLLMAAMDVALSPEESWQLLQQSPSPAKWRPHLYVQLLRRMAMGGDMLPETSDDRTQRASLVRQVLAETVGRIDADAHISDAERPPLLRMAYSAAAIGLCLVDESQLALDVAKTARQRGVPLTRRGYAILTASLPEARSTEVTTQQLWRDSMTLQGGVFTVSVSAHVDERQREMAIDLREVAVPFARETAKWVVRRISAGWQPGNDADDGAGEGEGGSLSVVRGHIDRVRERGGGVVVHFVCGLVRKSVRSRSESVLGREVRDALEELGEGDICMPTVDGQQDGVLSVRLDT